MKQDVQSHIKLPEKSDQVLFCSLTDHQVEVYQGYLNSDSVNSILSGRLKVSSAVSSKVPSNLSSFKLNLLGFISSCFCDAATRLHFSSCWCEDFARLNCSNKAGKRLVSAHFLVNNVSRYNVHVTLLLLEFISRFSLD